MVRFRNPYEKYEQVRHAEGIKRTKGRNVSHFWNKSTYLSIRNCNIKGSGVTKL